MTKYGKGNAIIVKRVIKYSLVWCPSEKKDLVLAKIKVNVKNTAKNDDKTLITKSV